MTDYATGVTTSVGLWDGGTGANVVPEFSTFEVDVRLPDAATAETVCARIEALKPHDPDVTVEVTGGLNRPAYEKSAAIRSEEHTSELQSLMRISYAVFCLKKKTNPHTNTNS